MSRSLGYAEVQVDVSDLEQPEQPEQPVTVLAPPSSGKPNAAQKSSRFRPVNDYPFDCPPLDERARPLFLQWWNESRWSKHRTKAVWTQAAFKAAGKRVAELAPGLQIELCTAGVEHGWQTLKYDYIREQGVLPVIDCDMLRNPASQQALAQVMEWAPQ
ncbi:MAG: hypothetical protein FJ083_14170 [Cyanobacteria bacterium K_Offshore_surface_m2_239]|nr:hypothetical protein [Cyanobacteria bacterium K_Offshore_surface_m2_239]